MNIGFDVSDLATNRADGTTRYTRELVKRMPTLSPQDTWQLFTPGDFNAGTLASNAKKIISPWKKYWTQARLPFDLYKHKPDVLFMPIQQLPIIRPKNMKTVAVIHDVAFHLFPEAFTYKDWLLLHTFTAHVVREADSIIAVSKATAVDVEKYYGRTKEVHVVHHGLDHNTFRVLSEAEKQASWEQLKRAYPNLKKPYILYVGQIQPRKNLVRLVEAFEVLKKNQPDLQLIIAGGHGWKQKEILERIKNSPQTSSILLPGGVPDALLPALYNHAVVFTLVSLYEGFGMPILEALACGTPVVTSNVSCMPEVAGNAATLVNPLSVPEIAEGIRSAMQKNNNEAGIKHAQQFTWENTARETYKIISS